MVGGGLDARTPAPSYGARCAAKPCDKPDTTRFFFLRLGTHGPFGRYSPARVSSRFFFCWEHEIQVPCPRPRDKRGRKRNRKVGNTVTQWSEPRRTKLLEHVQRLTDARVLFLGHVRIWDRPKEGAGNDEGSVVGHGG